ncbi:transcriptional regulator, IclR family [Prauserella aidingensis]|uniref:IclR family transcriptional regulator domain-containing protein n=1 Tax=Prauserella aidingensis TaxID=387890 RepID=UPI0020A5B627|nr:IclR family transcriptional regulator C-terminal domain-containing protein [Prauserella aidingensis]MCP2254563.1 transcriptional regulator, IclR family [Prauserella aidingensis]
MDGAAAAEAEGGDTADGEDTTGAELSPDGGERGRGTHHVQSLERGLAVITAFGPATPQLTLSEVAKATGLTRAAARRFLLTLVDLGYVRSDGRQFSLTAKVLELGYSFLSGLSLPGLAQPHLERLSAEVSESSSMSVLEGPDIVYVARVAVSRIMAVTISVGTRFPAHATSMGHVLLAGLSDEALEAYAGTATFDRFTDRTTDSAAALRAELAGVREAGYALVDQELEDGLRSIAVPVHGADGAVAAAVNLSTHASRRSPEAMRAELLPPLREAARGIEADLLAAAPPRTGSPRA